MSIRKRIEEKPRREAVARTASRVTGQILDDFPNVIPQPGTILVSTRAISARINKNMDGFPSKELKKAHQSFVGRPVFVNHQNLDHTKTRGIIRGSKYCEEGSDRYIKLCIEVDARAFPRLAKEIEEGRLDGVSMGCDVTHTVCSYCSNVAQDPYDFCSHVLYHKGQTLDRVDNNFSKTAVLVYEVCEGLNFFEISFVFDPADETALVQEVYIPGGIHNASAEDDGEYESYRDDDPRLLKNQSRNSREYAVIPRISYDDTVAPSDVDTLRDQKECPQCHDENFDGERCLWCNYIAPPEELSDPDIGKAQRVDLRQEIDDKAQQLQDQPSGAMNRSQRAAASKNPFVRRS